MVIVVLAATVAVLAIVLAVEEAAHRKERIDLYNRIMAKDANEYVRIVSAGKEPTETARQRKAKKWREEG